MTNKKMAILQQQIDDMSGQCYLIKHKTVSKEISFTVFQTSWGQTVLTHDPSLVCFFLLTINNNQEHEETNY